MLCHAHAYTVIATMCTWLHNFHSKTVFCCVTRKSVAFLPVCSLFFASRRFYTTQYNLYHEVISCRTPQQKHTQGTGISSWLGYCCEHSPNCSPLQLTQTRWYVLVACLLTVTLISITHTPRKQNWCWNFCAAAATTQEATQQTITATTKHCATPQCNSKGNWIYWIQHHWWCTGLGVSIAVCKHWACASMFF